MQVCINLFYWYDCDIKASLSAITIDLHDVNATINRIPDSKAHEANMGPTWVLSAPDGPHVSPMNLAIRGHATI